MARNQDTGGPAAADTRKFYVKSYGCQMNVYDAQRMADTLAREGMTATDTPEGADLIILNTCHIREKAAEKVYSELGRMRVLKQEAAEQDRRADHCRRRAASHRRKAPKSSAARRLSISWSARRAITNCRN